MNTKSRTAFASTAKRFTDYCTALDTGIYFWTFTLRNEYKDFQAPYIFSRVMTTVKDRYRHDSILFGGVRVIERQKKGRPHWHALVNKRIPIDWLEHVGAPLGMGWMWVEQARSSRAAVSYLSKYLQKENGNGFTGLGMPVWGTIGHAPFRTVSKDIIIRSVYTRFLARLRKGIFGDKPFPNWLAREVYQSHHVGYLEREDFMIWYAREHGFFGWEAWETLGWPEWLMQQEMEGIGVRDYDGRIPV